MIFTKPRFLALGAMILAALPAALALAITPTATITKITTTTSPPIGIHNFQWWTYELTVLQSATYISFIPTPIVAPTTVYTTIAMEFNDETHMTWINPSSPITTYFASSTRTYINTNGVHASQATHLPATVRRDEVPCAASKCGMEEDPECLALGLHTGCEGQCELQDEGFFCRWSFYGWYLNGEAMGRVCWGKGNVYRQLLKPCVQGDQKAGCTACYPGEESWTAAQW